QGGQYLPGAAFFLTRVSRPADKNTAAAGRISRAFRLVRAVDGDGVYGRLQARMPIHIEVRLVGLALGFEQGRGLLRKCGGKHVRTGFHRDADVEVVIHQVMVGAGRGRLYGEQPQPLASRLIFCAAARYRSSSVGERSPTVTLSKPWLDSSLGRSAATSTSSASRSRVAFWYSVRLSRRNVSVRPGLGLAKAALSSEAES